MINILYVYIGAGKKISSVKDKIVQIVHQFNQNDTNTHCKFFTVEVNQPEQMNDQVQMLPVPKTIKKYFKSWHQHRINIQTVFNFIESNHQDYDVIFFRYPGANKALYDGMKKFGSKILFEHNSKELEEHKLIFKDSKFGLNPSQFLTWYQNKKLVLGSEKKWGPKVLSLAKMGVAVTDDIANYEKERANGQYNCETSPNGIIVRSVKFRPFVPYDGKNLAVALISGASTAAPYLGVDRILEGLKKYTGDVNITLYCVGKIFTKEKDLVKAMSAIKQIQVVGELDGNGLDKFFDKIHISLGSIGLHRIYMKEGSVMKVNDSLSRGVPVVVGYDDMELKSCPDYAPYILKIAADESPLDFNRIDEFVSALSKDPDHANKIRELAQENTDLSSKIRRLVGKIKVGFGLDKNV